MQATLQPSISTSTVNQVLYLPLKNLSKSLWPVQRRRFYIRNIVFFTVLCLDPPCVIIKIITAEACLSL